MSTIGYVGGFRTRDGVNDYDAGTVVGSWISAGIEGVRTAAKKLYSLGDEGGDGDDSCAAELEDKIMKFKIEAQKEVRRLEGTAYDIEQSIKTHTESLNALIEDGHGMEDDEVIGEWNEIETAKTSLRDVKKLIRETQGSVAEIDGMRRTTTSVAMMKAKNEVIDSIQQTVDVDEIKDVMFETQRLKLQDNETKRIMEATKSATEHALKSMSVAPARSERKDVPSGLRDFMATRNQNVMLQGFPSAPGANVPAWKKKAMETIKNNNVSKRQPVANNQT
jgi:hypothetical protein